jgi:YegS/Rv2252/BmrU family lipid kinase
VPVRTPSRPRLLVGAGFCLAVLLFLSVLVQLHLTSLDGLDRGLGDGPALWTGGNQVAYQFLHGVELAFGTVALTVYTTVAVAMLLLRGHQRAALWTAAVMTASATATYLLKRWFQRDRPVWEDPVHTIDGFSFPSGHASGVAAAMGVATVLTLMFVRRRALRRGLVAFWILLVVLVGLDRIFLGVHNVSDVVAGYALGTFWVLFGMIVYDPTPKRRVVEALPSPVPSARQLAVVLNPIKVDDVDAFKVMVEEHARESGWSVPEWHETTVEDPGRSMAETAAIDGADLVLVCGGDGTVRTVCAELAGTGIPVGVIPAGTGNLLARNLGIPLYIQAAIDVALNGQDRAIDLVSVGGDGIPDGEHYMVMGGMGFDAAIMAGADDAIKAKIGWLAYFVSGIKQLRSPTFRVEISIDDGPFTKHRALTVVVGNVGYLTAGIPLLPDATIDDGVLDVVIVSPKRFVSWFPLLWRVMSKRRRVDEELNRMTGRKVVVRTPHETARQLDGDPIGPGKEIRAECIHGRLLVRVPR